MASDFVSSKQECCGAALSRIGFSLYFDGARTRLNSGFRTVFSVIFDFTFFALAIPAVIFAGISKGGFGSGAAFASASILALVFPPAIAIGVMLPLLMLMDVGSLRPYWRKWDWQLSKYVLIGCLPGVVLASLLYKATDPDVFRFLIGVISLAFVAWQIGNELGWITKRSRPIGRVGGMIAGATGGFTSFISHAGGPPVAVYLLSHPVSKTSYQASTVLIFAVINLTKAVPYTYLVIFSKQTLLADLYLAPFALIGVWIGVRAHYMIPEKAFFRLTYVLLVLTGSKLIWDSLT
ncbi:MAG: sulfite exporter TauE/SafE family protein [Paracoccaceae bacterium]|nr:sulfite exporter TauE/SafE family protein [Paracoccaceae bacterium]MDG1737934.1 sulfite exporter TauE/SafE family protein [Paracoccaceae bacterium]MDG2260384.1 sulfite exporter TauE/SafE family protein [Paracoccaceae bacterium]